MAMRGCRAAAAPASRDSTRLCEAYIAISLQSLPVCSRSSRSESSPASPPHTSTPYRPSRSVTRQGGWYSHSAAISTPSSRVVGWPSNRDLRREPGKRRPRSEWRWAQNAQQALEIRACDTHPARDLDGHGPPDATDVLKRLASGRAGPAIFSCSGWATAGYTVAYRLGPPAMLCADLHEFLASCRPPITDRCIRTPGRQCGPPCHTSEHTGFSVCALLAPRLLRSPRSAMSRWRMPGFSGMGGSGGGGVARHCDPQS